MASIPATAAGGKATTEPATRKTKAPASLSQQTDAAAHGTGVDGSSTAAPTAAAPPAAGASAAALWTLFALGWLFAPLWCAGVAAGLRSGGSRECLIRRRRGLSPAQLAAWRACAAMSMLSAAALVLVASMYFGRQTATTQGPFYLTLAGPSGSFPDLNDPAKLQQVAQAVHAALRLPASYPASNILVWVQASTELPAAARRRLLVASTQVYVLAYSLLQTPELPSTDELQQAMDDPQATSEMASQLEQSGFVAPEHAGDLAVGLTSKQRSEDVVGQLTGGAGSAASLVPIGKKDCEGSWSPAWSACSAACGDGTQARRFTVTLPAKAGGAACAAADGQVQSRECNTQPCSLNCTGAPTGPEARLGRAWTCADAGTAHGSQCSGDCIQGTEGLATAVCQDGAYQAVQGCQAGGLTFETISLANGSLLLDDTASDGFGWAGLLAIDAPSVGASELLCNGTNVLQHATISGRQALMTLPGQGAGYVYALNSGDTISLRSLFVAAPYMDGITVTLRALAAGGRAAPGSCPQTFTLERLVPTFIDLTAEAGFQDTYVVEVAASGGSRACFDGPVNEAAPPHELEPLVVIDNVDVAAGPRRDCAGAFGAASCSASCSGGFMTEAFSVMQAAANGGAACAHRHGATRVNESAPCNTEPCAPGAHWEYDACDALCGAGTQNRTCVATPGGPNRHLLTAEGCPTLGEVEPVSCVAPVPACPDCGAGWQDEPGSCNATCDTPQGFRGQVFNATLADDAVGYCASQGLLHNQSTRVLPCTYTGCCPGAWQQVTACNNRCFNATLVEVFLQGAQVAGRHLLAPVPPSPDCGFNGTERQVPCTPAQPCCSSGGQYREKVPCNATCWKTEFYYVDQAAAAAVEDPAQCRYNMSEAVVRCPSCVPASDCTGVPGELPQGVAAWTCGATAHGANCSAQCDQGGATGEAMAACLNGTFTVVQNCTAAAPPAAPAPLNCTDSPIAQFGGAWDCASGMQDGFNCTGSCLTKRRHLLGTPARAALCTNGTYSLVQDCIYT